MNRTHVEDLAASNAVSAAVCALALAGDEAAALECRLAHRAAHLASEAAYSTFCEGDPSPWAENEYDDGDPANARDAAASAAELLAWFRQLNPAARVRCTRQMVEDGL